MRNAGAEPGDEIVVEVEAAQRQLEERRRVTFDVGDEHAGRGPGRTLADAARIKDRDRSAAHRKLVSDGAAHYARADDRDVHWDDCTG